jgi:hypothetical protein
VDLTVDLDDVPVVRPAGSAVDRGVLPPVGVLPQVHNIPGDEGELVLGDQAGGTGLRIPCHALPSAGRAGQQASEQGTGR